MSPAVQGEFSNTVTSHQQGGIHDNSLPMASERYVPFIDDSDNEE
jgi:hypothetical protein